MAAPIRYKAGQKVKLTDASFQNVLFGNRSVMRYPSDSYVASIRDFLGCEGVVVHTHLPGYEITVKFEKGGVEKLFHAKDNFVEPA